MKRALTLLLLRILLLPTSAISQESESPLVVTLPQGGFAAFEMEVSPLNSPLSLQKPAAILQAPFVPRVVMGDRNVLHRLLVDEQGRIVFAYDLVIRQSGL
jgi:hypothetical protein